MQLEIVSPERTLLTAEVDSVIVPGTDGSFQMLNNHAPIVSTLISGVVKISGDFENSETLPKSFSVVNPKELHLSVSSGVIEMKENKVILTPVLDYNGDEFSRYRQFRTAAWYESMKIRNCEKILSNDHAFGFLLNIFQSTLSKFFSNI